MGYGNNSNAHNLSFTSIDVDSGISLRIITDRITLALTLVPVSSICKNGESVDDTIKLTKKASLLTLLYFL